MSLEKLIVKNTDTNEEFKVLFNPTEFGVEDSNSWKEQERERRKPELQFTGQTLKKLSMELFLDTYEKNEDVRTYTVKFSKLLNVSVDDGSGARPPILLLNWGSATGDLATSIFPFTCILESLKQQFTLFTSDGKPVRAKLSVAFKEYSNPPQDNQENPRRNSFPTQTYTVKSGDTLAGIAAALWKDHTRWREIAAPNEIFNPRLLTPGQVLIIPKID